MSSSAVVHFELDCSPIDQVPFDRAVYSDKVSAGGHDWRMACTPKDVDGFVSVYLELISQAKNVQVIFDAAITGSDQVVGPSCFSRRRTVHVYSNPLGPGEYVLSGFARFIHRDDLRYHAGSNGRVTVMCAVSVLDDGRIAKAPPLPKKKGIAALLSEIGDHLGCLLDSAALSDVSFVVGDDEEAPPLRAHRAILAARSPVFKAQFCGHMLEAANTETPLVITVPDMDSETFKAMLRFMYTDNLPAGLGLGHDEEGEEDEALRSLLAAADRYALDRLKLLCARKLLGNMSVDTVAAVLDCAETYNCPELKTKCIEFVVADENFDKVALTDAFIDLVVTRSPSLLAEMRNIAEVSSHEL